MMRKILLSCLLVSAFSLVAQEEKKEKVLSGPKDLANFFVAKQRYFAGSYSPALNSFKQLEQGNPDDSDIKYYIAACYYALGNYQKSKESLVNAINNGKSVNAQANLLYAKILQHEGQEDKAIEQFSVFIKSTGVLAAEKKMAEVLTEQCLVAKKLKQTPLKVGVTNLGSEINSRFDDKNPCITADGKTLVFTTRRPESPDSPVDAEGDGRHFENIYFSHADSVSSSFGQAHPFEKTINTPAHDACTSISPDGKQLFIYKNDINKRESRGGNVFVSKQLNGKWKKPESLGKPINTAPNWEGGACLSADGKRYFFCSERPEGFGGSDIWMVERKSKKLWGEPVNLGALVNSKYDEAGMFLAPDGKTLFFCSNGPKSMGSYDVFRTVYENGQWSEPVNLGYPINTPAREGQLTISADARYAYISSDRSGGIGESDLYKIDLMDYAILEKDGIKKTGNGLGILRGTIREGFEGYGIPEVEVVVKNETNAVVASAITNESGEYFATLRSGKYSLTINKKGYKEIVESFEVPVNDKESPIVEKGYLLKKQ